MTRTAACVQAPWDAGVRWLSRCVIEPEALPLTVEYVTNAVLRAADPMAEYDYIEACIRAATAAAEQDTQRALMPQTWEMVLSGFPASGYIPLERPPFIAAVDVTYYDGDGTAQPLAVSPAEFDVVGSGAYRKAQIRPLDGGSWPSTGTREDAVVIRYQAGYESANDPVFNLIKMGIALMVGELYKQHTLSVHAVHNSPSLLQLSRFWQKVY